MGTRRRGGVVGQGQGGGNVRGGGKFGEGGGGGGEEEEEEGEEVGSLSWRLQALEKVLRLRFVCLCVCVQRTATPADPCCISPCVCA